MTITDAKSAAEFVGAWLRECTPARAHRFIGFCLESQRTCLAYDESKHLHASAANARAAIAVLEQGLAAAARLGGCE